MRALLLCAGLGTRLRPLTDVLPKCLVPINGRPLLEYWLFMLFEGGIERVLINLHHKKEEVMEYLDKSIWRDRVDIVEEKELLGTAGTLKKNADYFSKDESFVLIHGDNFCDFDFQEYLRAHEKKSSLAKMTMLLFRTETPETCGIVELSPEGIVEAFHEKKQNPPSNLANGAVYICDHEILEFVQNIKKDVIDFSTEVIPAFMGKIATFENKGIHRDIGNPESYRRVQKESEVFAKVIAQNIDSAWDCFCQSLDEREVDVPSYFGKTFQEELKEDCFWSLEKDSVELESELSTRVENKPNKKHVLFLKDSYRKTDLVKQLNEKFHIDTFILNRH